MSLLDDTKINMSLKKLVGKSHSTNDKDPANEADASYLITMADNVWVDDISTDTTAAVNAGVAEEIVAELDADITSNGKSYTLKYPVGHAKAGQRIYDSIPDSIHFNYEPKLYSAYPGSPIFGTDAADWVFDNANGTITSEDNLGLTGTARCKVFVYVGNKLSTAGSVGKSFAVDEYTLTANQVDTTKQITLSNTPTNDQDVQMIVYGGVAQNEGPDYTVSGTTLSWNGLGLDGIIETGDKIAVSYSYAG